MKRAYEKGKQATPKMMVSAWGAEARMALAARAVNKGKAAAIEMLRHLDIEGPSSPAMRSTSAAYNLIRLPNPIGAATA
jgi:hypothetical protein